MKDGQAATKAATPGGGLGQARPGPRPATTSAREASHCHEMLLDRSCAENVRLQRGGLTDAARRATIFAMLHKDIAG